MPPARPTVMLLRVAGRREELLEQLGVDGTRVVDAPTSRHEALDEATLAPLDALLDGQSSPDIVVLTSAEASRALVARALGFGTTPARALARTLVAVVGPATGRPLVEAGRRPDLVAIDRRAEGVVAVLQGAVSARLRAGTPPHVMIVRALEGRPELIALLESLGARVTLAPVYRTVDDPAGLEEAARRLEHDPPDLVVATSGRPLTSLARAFREITGREPQTPVAVLGPVAAADARLAGFRVVAMAAEADIDALVAAVRSHLRKDQS